MAMLNNQRGNSVDSPNALDEPMETQRKPHLQQIQVKNVKRTWLQTNYTLDH